MKRDTLLDLLAIVGLGLVAIAVLASYMLSTTPQVVGF